MCKWSYKESYKNCDQSSSFYFLSKRGSLDNSFSLLKTPFSLGGDGGDLIHSYIRRLLPSWSKSWETSSSCRFRSGGLDCHTSGSEVRFWKAPQRVLCSMRCVHHPVLHTAYSIMSACSSHCPRGCRLSYTSHCQH